MALEVSRQQADTASRDWRKEHIEADLQNTLAVIRAIASADDRE
jgi:hypothetical protein